MITDQSFHQLAEQLRAGDRDAAAEVVALHADRLRGLAHRRLDARVRAKVDPEDIAQAVFEDFFRRCANGEFTFRSWDDIRAVLNVMTARRCAWEGRWYTAARRDIRREVPERAGAGEADWMDNLAGRGTPPEQDVLVNEALSGVMKHLTVADRAVVKLALQGQAVADISAAVGRTPRAVYRVLQSVRELLSARAALV